MQNEENVLFDFDDCGNTAFDGPSGFGGLSVMASGMPQVSSWYWDGSRGCFWWLYNSRIMLEGVGLSKLQKQQGVNRGMQHYLSGDMRRELLCYLLKRDEDG
jgi:hypothetical protein